MSDKFRLGHGETNTDCWRKLKAHYEARLANLRAKAENPMLEESVRIGFLWRIQEIKDLLSLGEPAKDKAAG